ncbi:hypothetical protein AVEN_242276-1 [Araneus ventricosus]|uniref:Uncharacterized protein n=1 Tax=Araneus ventricosus TaxID=182803 RepID=A0A4Y2T0H3_ARAVE|nr:hypothetical protein AVEN_242276-1 [Araneus ventricosus]
MAGPGHLTWRRTPKLREELDYHFCDLGGKFGVLGVKLMIPEYATLLPISLLGKKIRLNLRENSMWRHGLSGRVYKGIAYIREWSVDRLERLWSFVCSAS